jgi:GT2 family glycosyltransferase
VITPRSLRLSFIVPFHRGLSDLSKCLRGLDRRPPGSELIVVADGAIDDCRRLARTHGARVISLARRSGPAVARNAGAGAATGDVLVFVDADVVASSAGLTRVLRIFVEQPQTAAAFGCYDELPPGRTFMSQYKNLSHSYIHQTANTDARTFWAGFGAVRRPAFNAVGGFDERFDRPSVEDIDLGYRLSAAGYSIVVDPVLSACHLKEWTFFSAIASDVRDRGIPWTQLIFRYRALADDLNVRNEYRWSVVFAYLLVLAVTMSAFDWRHLAGVPTSIAAITILNGRYYQFFRRRRGWAFAVRASVVHFLQHLYNGVSFAAGAFLFFSARFLRVRLPGALATEGWTGALPRAASVSRTS